MISVFNKRIYSTVAEFDKYDPDMDRPYENFGEVFLAEQEYEQHQKIQKK